MDIIPGLRWNENQLVRVHPNCNPFPFSTQGYPIPFQPHPPTSEKPRCQEIQEASDEVANGPPNQLGHLAEWGHQWWMVMWWLPVSGSQCWFPSHLQMKLWMIIKCAAADDNNYGGGGHGHDAGGNHDDTEYCWVCDDYDNSISHCKSDDF